ncbi:MAG: type IV pilin-like G/H family protein [Desertifilum sp.]|nr:type IV pilin-like G/H family protein [Desertifilum sp.]
MSRPNRRGNIALNWVKLVALFILAGFGIEVLKYIVLGNFISANNRVYRARNNEAKLQITTFNKAQEFFYLDNHQFADAIDALELQINPQAKYFNYSLQVGKNAVFNYGIPRTDVYEMASLGFLFWRRSTSRSLKSYVGGVFAIAESVSENGKLQTVSVLCESAKPGFSKIGKPRLENYQPICPEGTVQIGY